MSQESENRFLVLFLLIKTENNFTVRCGILLSGQEETKVLTGYLEVKRPWNHCAGWIDSSGLLEILSREAAAFCLTG